MNVSLLTEPEIEAIATKSAMLALKMREKETAKLFPEVMTISQLSEYLKFSEPTIRKWIKEEYLPFHRLGDSMRFYKTEVDSWVKSRGK
jgi:excisionase family DNA binding protein